MQAEEATLPVEIKAVQTVLEGELEALKALEASTPPAPRPLTTLSPSGTLFVIQHGAVNALILIVLKSESNLTPT